MNYRQWRELVEIVGVISIVIGLLVVAMEVRQSNKIGKAQIEQQIASGYDIIHVARATNADFARLFAKLLQPEKHLITATDLSQLQGLVWHAGNIGWSAQVAYDAGLLDRQSLAMHARKIALLIETRPLSGVEFVSMYESNPSYHGAEVFASIDALSAEGKAAEQAAGE